MAPSPSTGPWADVADNVNIDGTLWHACDVSSPRKTAHPPPATPAAGRRCSSSARPRQTGHPRRQHRARWISKPSSTGYCTMTCPVTPTPTSSPRPVEAISQGLEIASTGGVAETFAGNGFTVTASWGGPGLRLS